LGPGNALQQWQQTIQYADAVTYIHGRHALKFGGDFRFNQVNKLNGRNDPSGGFGFGGGYTGNPQDPSGTQTVSMADFLLGMPNTYTIQPPTFKWGARKREASWFVQDDWKLSPTITVNFGLRQDLQFGWHEVKNRYSNFSPTIVQPALLTDGSANPYAGLLGGQVFGVSNASGNHLTNFAPRLGIAWSLDQKTVLRGGAGAFIVPASTITDYGDVGEGSFRRTRTPVSLHSFIYRAVTVRSGLSRRHTLRPRRRPCRPCRQRSETALRCSGSPET
jgi:outer membrane receptor for ferrienterochelin and colicin